MITGPLKSKVDLLWTEFWTGGITNPLTVIEQISFLIFLRLLDVRESRNEKMIQRLGERAGGDAATRLLFRPDQQHLRWSLLKQLGGKEMLELMRRTAGPQGQPAQMGVFEHMRAACAQTPFGQYFRDAQLYIEKDHLLVRAVHMVDELPLESGDTKGDLYEYLLSKLTTAGVNGQFRTPRHLIDMMVQLVDPRPGERICDPACGTAGFLVRALEHILRQNTSPDGRIDDGAGGVIHTGDLLNDAQRAHLQGDAFTGFDFDATMLRVSAMNMLLHGVETPLIRYQDTLGNSFPENHPTLVRDHFDVILANPPFKGSLDQNNVMNSLRQKVKTTKTELLFLVLMLQMLRVGGRCAVVVPNGVQFGSSGAHVAVRRMLVDGNQLEAVVGLPSGVFKPYAGVSTAVLVFTKGGQTGNVLFCDVQADGYSLDDKRQRIDEDDLPRVVEAWTRLRAQLRQPRADLSAFQDRTGLCFLVPRDEIVAQNYDLSVSRYKEHVHEAVEHEPPRAILAKLRALEAEISADLDALEGMLK